MLCPEGALGIHRRRDYLHYVAGPASNQGKRWITLVLRVLNIHRQTSRLKELGDLFVPMFPDGFLALFFGDVPVFVIKK